MSQTQGECPSKSVHNSTQSPALFLTVWRPFSLFAALVALVMGLFVHFQRVKVPDHDALVIFNALGYSFLVLVFPNILQEAFARRNNRTWLTSHSAFTLGTILVLLFCSIFPENLVQIAGVIIIGLGWGGFLTLVYQYLRKNPWWDTLLLALGAYFLGHWLSWIVYGSGYLSPLFEKTLLTKIHSPDTLFHTSITNMLLTYGVPSTGLYGPELVKVYFGAHWLFSRFAYLLATNAIVFFEIGAPIIFLPLFIKSILAYAGEIYETRAIPVNNVMKLVILFILGIAITGFLTQELLLRAAVHWPVYLSETYYISILFLALLGGLLVRFTAQVLSEQEGGKSSLIFLWIVLPLMICAVGWGKLSVMLLLLPALIYLYLRLELYKRADFNLSVLLSLLIAGIMTYATWPLGGESGFEIKFMSFIKERVLKEYRPYFLYLHWFWPLLYIFQRMKQSGIRNLGEMANAVRQRSILDIEVLLIFCILGIIPGLFVNFPGGAAIYFSDVQRWVGVCFLLGILPELLRSSCSVAGKASLKLLPLKVICTIFVLAAIVNAINQNAKYFRGHFKENRANIEEKYNQDRFIAEKQLLLGSLLSLNNLSLMEKQRALLWIPRSNKIYWNYFQDCHAVAYLAPAMTGISLLDGLPSKNCNEPPAKKKYYGLAHYDKFRNPKFENIKNPRLACKITTEMGYMHLYKMDPVPPYKIHKTICPARLKHIP